MQSSNRRAGNKYKNWRSTNSDVGEGEENVEMLYNNMPTIV